MRRQAAGVVTEGVLTVKKKLPIICAAVLAVALVVLGVRYKALEQEYLFVQRNVDGIFAAAYDQLWTGLFGMEDSEARQERLVSSAGKVTALLSSTSYRDNGALELIVLYLAQTEPLGGQNPVPTDDDLISRLGYLHLHLDDEALAEEIWAALESGG